MEELHQHITHSSAFYSCTNSTSSPLMHVHAHRHTDTHMCTHRHTDTHTHTCTHTHTHTHTTPAHDKDGLWDTCNGQHHKGVAILQMQATQIQLTVKSLHYMSSVPLSPTQVFNVASSGPIYTQFFMGRRKSFWGSS